MASSNFSFIFKGLGENWQTELDKLIDFCERPIIANGEVVVLSVYVGISLSKYYLYSSTDDLIHGAEIALVMRIQEP